MAERQAAIVEVIDWDHDRVFGVGREALTHVYKLNRGYWETDWYSLIRQWKEVEGGRIEDVVIAEPDDIVSVRFHPPQSYLLNDQEGPEIALEFGEIPLDRLRYLYLAELTELADLFEEMSGEYQLDWCRRSQYRLNFPKKVYAKGLDRVEVPLL